MDTTLVLEAIAEPTRRRILDTVRDGECSVGDLVAQIGMNQPGVSRHLKVLRDSVSSPFAVMHSAGCTAFGLSRPAGSRRLARALPCRVVRPSGRT